MTAADRLREAHWGPKRMEVLANILSPLFLDPAQSDALSSFQRWENWMSETGSDKPHVAVQKGQNQVQTQGRLTLCYRAHMVPWFQFLCHRGFQVWSSDLQCQQRLKTY